MKNAYQPTFSCAIAASPIVVDDHWKSGSSPYESRSHERTLATRIVTKDGRVFSCVIKISNSRSKSFVSVQKLTCHKNALDSDLPGAKGRDCW